MLERISAFKWQRVLVFVCWPSIFCILEANLDQAYPTETFSEPNTDMFMAIFGRTDLRKSLSRAKFDEESDFEVRLAVAPQKPRQIGEKRNFETNKFRKTKFARRESFCARWESFREGENIEKLRENVEKTYRGVRILTKNKK